MALPTRSTPDTTLSLRRYLHFARPSLQYYTLSRDLRSSFSPEEELSEAEKRIQKTSISEIVNKLELCLSAGVATPDPAGLLYLCDGQGNWGRSMITMLSSRMIKQSDSKYGSCCKTYRQGNWGRSRYASLAQGPEFLFGRREEKTKLKTPRLPDGVYSAILAIGRLRQAENFWETIAHSPSDTSGHDSSGCTEWFCDKSNCIASRRNVSKRAQLEGSSR
ncbi:putative f-box domain-containing protein [Botrytis fragariae]|uniref:Putative f-box domain-containing protein n=1 Tax=Botrytis fragariae TaxID=1964551 RepID=A0A8H6ATE6_9HELO|nr:putative f-box domain-containing protein [Botrytis fragariae]KAF5873154.1 putative f-box domain-containing protein [Botrytis fragariae]